jgi:hypothetical protein
MEEDVTVELPDKVFVITLKNGRQLFSRAAVLSIGVCQAGTCCS